MKRIGLAISCACILICAFAACGEESKAAFWAGLSKSAGSGGEYTILYSGDINGNITIQKVGKKITINKSLNSRDGDEFYIDNTLCPWLPKERILIWRGITEIIIDGNTTTTTVSDGSWYKEVKEGNTTTVTYPDGFWYKEVKEGNTTTVTYPDGFWWKTVKEGNTTTTTYPDGFWWKTVKEGNTTTTTYPDGRWSKEVKEGNTTTTTYPDGRWSKEVVTKDGHIVFVEKTSG